MNKKKKKKEEEEEEGRRRRSEGQSPGVHPFPSVHPPIHPSTNTRTHPLTDTHSPRQESELQVYCNRSQRGKMKTRVVCTACYLPPTPQFQSWTVESFARGMEFRTSGASLDPHNIELGGAGGEGNGLAGTQRDVVTRVCIFPRWYRP